MCGLFGVVRFDGVRPSDHDKLAALGDQLRHRGPNGSGFIETPQALLGMHRLSIMDVDHGWQPFWSERKEVGVLGNGEIYNYSSLSVGVQDRGHRLHTGSDIEVVPHLYEDLRTDSFSTLRGMYALIVLDQQSQRLFLVRDRLGEKPLCYARIDSGLVFASEQSALVRSGVIPFTIDPAVLPEYLLHGFTPEPLSLISGVRKVPAGAFLEIDLATGTIAERRYWSLLDSLDNRPLTTAELTVGIEEAVEICCQSDVPMGLALSGGLDSSMVALIASRVRPDLHAFSIGYGGASSDESVLAAEFAADLGIPCTVTHLDAREVGTAFAETCIARDEPVSDIAGPALSAVSEAARRAGVPVLMTGIGGDEWFWGYDWVRRLGGYTYGRLSASGSVPKPYSLAEMLPAPSPAGVARWLETRGGRKTETDIDAFIRRWSDDDKIPLALYEFQHGYPGINRTIVDLCRITDDFPRPHGFMPRRADMAAGEYIRALCDTYLQVNSLGQMDRLSMHHSVEARTPLTDYRLAELVMSSRRAGDGSLSKPVKYELRKVAEAVLPSQVVNRPKRGFTPPVREWVGEIWRSNAAAFSKDSALAASGLLDARHVLASLRSPTYRTGRINQIALRLATLELWYRSF
jgi:asparagine synthase (glutamine-hydrolysing)